MQIHHSHWIRFGARPLIDPDWDEPAKNYGDILDHVRRCKTLKDDAAEAIRERIDIVRGDND